MLVAVSACLSETNNKSSITFVCHDRPDRSTLGNQTDDVPTTSPVQRRRFQTRLGLTAVRMITRMTLRKPPYVHKRPQIPNHDYVKCDCCIVVVTLRPNSCLIIRIHHTALLTFLTAPYLIKRRSKGIHKRTWSVLFTSSLPSQRSKKKKGFIYLYFFC